MRGQNPDPRFGDPVVPGWITPAIPLLIAYCESYAPGTERVHALIAFQFMLGAVSIGLGATGLARHVVRAVPSALKAGVVMGAGLAAVNTVFADDGRFWTSIKYLPWLPRLSVSMTVFAARDVT